MPSVAIQRGRIRRRQVPGKARTLAFRDDPATDRPVSQLVASMVRLTTLPIALTIATLSCHHLHTETMEARQTVPALAFLDQRGNASSLASVRGSVAIIAFWATWCIPCRTELPLLSHLARQHGSRHLAVFTVADKDDSWDDISLIKNALDLTLPIFRDDGTAAKALRIHAFPTVIVIDKQGRIAWREVGLVTPQVLSEAVTNALLERAYP
jgi:thiol-disulfide isomerase/thioredoxin